MVKKTSILTTGLVLGGSVLLLAFLNKRLDITGQFSGGLKSIGESIGSGVTGFGQGILSGGAEGAGGIVDEASKIGENIGKFFEERFGPGGGTPASGTQDAAADDEFFKNLEISKLLPTFNPAPNTQVTFSNPLSFSTRGGTNLDISGVRGTLTNIGTGIRGAPLAPTAISRRQQTITGSITTPAGGTRQIAGSPALFERLRRNLGG